MVKYSWSDSQNRSGAIVHLCMSSLRLQTIAVYVTLVNKTVLLLHSFRDDQIGQDSYLNLLVWHNIYKYLDISLWNCGESAVRYVKRCRTESAQRYVFLWDQVVKMSLALFTPGIKMPITNGQLYHLHLVLKASPMTLHFTDAYGAQKMTEWIKISITLIVSDKWEQRFQ